MKKSNVLPWNSKKEAEPVGSIREALMPLACLPAVYLAIFFRSWYAHVVGVV
jgi:hypothetical protein